MIVANAAKCLKCGDEIYSAFTHDLTKCRCGEIYVDGGQSYIRHGYKSIENYIDLSIFVDEQTFTMCMSALDWCDETGRNNFGRVCAIFRGLRDSGFLNKEENE